MMLNEYAIGGYYMMYYLLCIPCAVCLTLLLPNRLKKNFWLTFIFCYLLSVSLSFLGVILALFLAWSFRIASLPRTQIKGLMHSALLDYQKSPLFYRTYFGETLSTQLMQKDAFSQDTRKKMMVAVNAFQSGQVTQLNKHLLCDDDDMRLHAQNMLDRQEIKLFQLIHHMNTMMQQENDPHIKALLKKQIAQLMWESIRQTLAEEDNLGMMLNKIKSLVEEALAQLNQDASLSLLLGQIALKQNDLASAKHWINKAQDHKAPYYRIALYLGEIAFREQRFTEVKTLLSGLEHQGVVGAWPIIDFWSVHE